MNLKDVRTKRGYTQQEVADYIGCSAVVYSRYETGTRQPPIDVLMKLSDMLGVTIDYLLGRENVDYSTLSAYEVELVTAARNADERAREDALKMLIDHSGKEKERSHA